VRELADVTAAVLDDVDLVAVVDCLHGRKASTHLSVQRPASTIFFYRSP